MQGGFVIGHSHTEEFRYGRILRAHLDSSLKLPEILHILLLPIHAETVSGKTMRIEPTTLYINWLKFRLVETDETFMLKGKIPRGELKKQASASRVKGDQDRRVIVLNVFGAKGEELHNPDTLTRIGDALPKKMYFYRVCRWEKREDVVIELECKEIWNDGETKVDWHRDVKSEKKEKKKQEDE